MVFLSCWFSSCGIRDDQDNTISRELKRLEAQNHTENSASVVATGATYSQVLHFKHNVVAVLHPQPLNLLLQLVHRGILPAAIRPRGYRQRATKEVPNRRCRKQEMPAGTPSGGREGERDVP